MGSNCDIVTYSYLILVLLALPTKRGSPTSDQLLYAPVADFLWQVGLAYPGGRPFTEGAHIPAH